MDEKLLNEKIKVLYKIVERTYEYYFNTIHKTRKSKY